MRELSHELPHRVKHAMYQVSTQVTLRVNELGLFEVTRNKALCETKRQYEAPHNVSA